MPFTSKDILGTQYLTKEEILSILETAESFKEISTRSIKKVPTLRGRTIINMFFEPSTRTRTSFEIAGKRLSADVINISGSTSSVTKGESLLDTAYNLEAMQPDILVVRHSSSGAPEMISKHIDCPVINAGDGTHEHPSQALLDLLTIKEKMKKLDGLSVAIVGDILHSRVARSNIFAMTKLGMRVKVVGPPTLIPLGIENLNVTVEHDLENALKDVDVVMMLRIQLERQKQGLLSSFREYSNLFGLTAEKLKSAKKELLILHPGPVNRGIEISLDVLESPHSLVLHQVTNGLAVRMALMYLLLGASNENSN